MVGPGLELIEIELQGDVLLLDFLEPWVFENLCRGKAEMRLCDHLSDEMLGLLRDVHPFRTIKVEVSLPDTVENLLIVVTEERRIPTQQDIQDNTSGPDIARLVVGPCENLGGDVIGSPCAGLHDDLLGLSLHLLLQFRFGLYETIFLENLREPEINDLNGTILVLGQEEEVLWL